MTALLYLSTLMFWLLLLYYSVVTIAGVKQRADLSAAPPLSSYPSVAVLIPAFNEEVVIADTLRAMQRLHYPGELNIYVLDDQSTDDTAEVVRRFTRVFSSIHHITVPAGNYKGKSRVLNYGLHISNSDYFVVFDADNEPEPDAVRKLVEQAEQTEKAAGAVGYVKTKNMYNNWLTRMIGLEFQVFQLLMQSGRWTLFKLGSLAGTNMLLKRSVLEEVGGYDEQALAEDAELTVRISSSGYMLPVVPGSRTWEQEPEQLRAFIKQRTRWLTGNIYIMEKSFHELTHWKGRTFFLSIQHVLTYLIFILLLLFSDIFFVMGLAGFPLPEFAAPLLLIWFISYVVYISHFFSAIVMDENVSLKNVGYILIMYFTYAQIFLILLTRSLFVYLWGRIRNKTIAWDKTQRYKSKGEET
ncbi:glycosyltransferase family 2 protein [Salibacterium sp. K-3]